ncbi:MAG TPA: diguanylate cyclase [Gaiellaceae bacterium]|nr:diguanylate cyclase [Gaiellaceae bacterium]
MTSPQPDTAAAGWALAGWGPGGRPSLPGEPGSELSRRGLVYVVLVVCLGFGAAAATWLRGPVDGADWLTFAALAAGATLTQAFPVKTPRNALYHTSVVFLVAAALLLPPQLIALIPLAQTVPAWARERRPWPLHGFAVANYALNALAAWGAANLVEVHGAGLVPGAEPRFALAGLAACVAFVAFNHVVLAAAPGSAGRRFRGSGLLSPESLSVDLVLTMLGVSLAAFWETNPWLVVAAVAPLVVVHRSLSVPQLQAEARVDPKTGLYNARYFSTALAAELSRASRFERPMAVIMADLDLLRDVNNSYGHLAGDAVLRGIAETFRQELRHYDVPARFGGEEFSILLPETDVEQALEIAERIRRAVAEREFQVATADEPVRATVSIGVAAYPGDGLDANELVHQADLAVYRAKLQGRNRVLGASSEPLLLGAAHARPAPLRPVPAEDPAVEAAPASPAADTAEDEGRAPARHELLRLRSRSLEGMLGPLVASVAVAGVAGGLAALVLGGGRDLTGLLAVIALVAGSQALSFELTDVAGSISVAVVGALAGAALFDYRVALPLAAATAAVEWVQRRGSLHHALYTVGSLSLAALATAGVFSVGAAMSAGTLVHALTGVAAGAVYFAVSMSLLSLASGLETGERPWRVFQERCAWLVPHYLVYGFIGGVIAVAYDAVGIYALAVFAVPLLLMRNTQAAFVRHSQRASHQLREAAETIHAQNVSLEQANQLLRERSTAAMESLSATVDARDAYTAGHSRRVRELALALGRELGLSQAELDLLDRAALFHDIGKLAVPDSILLKPGRLDADEWLTMQRHAEEGARIIERLGFLQDAVPSIRHHHERWDGAGYPDRLQGDDIPLGARIIHVADALDSMLTTRIYRSARPLADALAEIRRASGSQFCPRCVTALERLLPLDAPLEELPALAAAAS